MGKERLEAFSDGVIAIIITIMVLELKVPHGGDFSALFPLFPRFLSYVLSFLYLAIYWNNHHHLLKTISRVNGSILWANMHLLFWLSLIPFATGWMGENSFTSAPTALYGFVLLMAAVSYFILQYAIINGHEKDSLLARAVGKDVKGKVSLVLYATAIVLTCVSPWMAQALYAGVALMWLIPDYRIERMISEERGK